MKKKLLSFVMSATLLAGLMPVNIQAQEAVAEPLQTEATLSDAFEEVTETVQTEEEILVEDTLEVEANQVRIDATNFPDENFRKYIKEEFDADNDDIVDDIENIKEIFADGREIHSLKGIEHFRALEHLICSRNQLTSLDVSKNTALIRLECSNNQLTSLDVSKNTALYGLKCSVNQLTSLDVSKNTRLLFLYCYYNRLTSLDVSKNTVLEEFVCSNNQLTSLDVSKNMVLEEFTCSGNQLTSLDVSKNTALLRLECADNQLTSLDVSKNTALSEIGIDSNIITDISDLNVSWLYIYVPQLKGTIDLSNITGIEKYMSGSGWNADTKKYTYDMETEGDNFGGVYAIIRNKCILTYVIYGSYLTTYQGYGFYKDADGNVRCIDSNRNVVINEFKCDGTYTYYFQADGTAVKNRFIYDPDGKHVIYFDENGHEVFSYERFASYQGCDFIKDANGNVRCIDSNSNPVINEFKCDGTYTYYFQLDGTAMRNRLTYHPDGKHVIYFDENGHEVFSNFHHVEKSIAGEAVDDLCFFDVYGYMYVDVMTYDQAGKKLYYVNPYGVIEQGKWFEFSDTCVWAGTTNKVGKGYGYANADGTLLINTYTFDWLGRYVYLQGNGHIQ